MQLFLGNQCIETDTNYTGKGGHPMAIDWFAAHKDGLRARLPRGWWSGGDSVFWQENSTRMSETRALYQVPYDPGIDPW